MYAAMGVIGVALGMKAVQYYKGSNKEPSNSYLENAGIPDQSPEITDTQLENSKMVSEGSTFGVHYYNMHNKNE